MLTFIVPLKWNRQHNLIIFIHFMIRHTQSVLGDSIIFPRQKSINLILNNRYFAWFIGFLFAIFFLIFACEMNVKWVEKYAPRQSIVRLLASEILISLSFSHKVSYLLLRSKEQIHADEYRETEQQKTFCSTFPMKSDGNRNLLTEPSCLVSKAIRIRFHGQLKTTLHTMISALGLIFSLDTCTYTLIYITNCFNWIAFKCVSLHFISELIIFFIVAFFHLCNVWHSEKTLKLLEYVNYLTASK